MLILEAVIARQFLPIFALNTVLFPGALLPLHVFEHRYRRMVADCLDSGRRRFAVLLIKQGDEVLESPAPGLLPEGRPPLTYDVGTIAEIQEVEQLPDGRYVLVCRGGERVRRVSGTQHAPYPAGEFEPYPTHPAPQDPEGPEATIEPLASRVREAVTRIIQALAGALPPDQHEQRRHLDRVLADAGADPLTLSYFVPRLLFSAGNSDKQRLLEAPTTAERLRLELPLIVLEEQVSRHVGNDPTGADPSLN